MQGTLKSKGCKTKLSADLSCLHRESHRNKEVAGEKIGE